MDFKAYLAHSKIEIDRELEGIFRVWRKKAEDLNIKLKPFVEEAIEATTTGGKRLRGTLVRLGYQLAGGRNDRAILEVASAVEIFQTSILIHDDIIDQSDTRRSRKTTYKQLGGDRIGESLAITLGDAGVFLGYNILLKRKFNPQLKSKALKFFNDSLSYTCLGQLLDIDVPRSQRVSKKDLFDIF
jgi:geranylgeranyl diphosphate synthase type I